jgi:hypothetical protein
LFVCESSGNLIMAEVLFLKNIVSMRATARHRGTA